MREEETTSEKDINFLYERLKGLNKDKEFNTGLIRKFSEIHVPEIFFEKERSEGRNEWNFDLRRYMLPNQEDSGVYGAKLKCRSFEDQDMVYVFQPKDVNLIKDIEEVITGIENREAKFLFKKDFTNFKDRIDMLFCLETDYYRDEHGTIRNPRDIHTYICFEDLIEKL